jgi:hypothetical protein
VVAVKKRKSNCSIRKREAIKIVAKSMSSDLIGSEIKSESTPACLIIINQDKFYYKTKIAALVRNNVTKLPITKNIIYI